MLFLLGAVGFVAFLMLTVSSFKKQDGKAKIYGIFIGITLVVAIVGAYL